MTTSHELARMLLTHQDGPVVLVVIDHQDGISVTSITEAPDRVHVELISTYQHPCAVAVTAYVKEG